MNPTFALAFSAGTVVLVAALTIAMPALVPRTVPLGVTIPATRTGESAVRGAIRRFRIAQVVAAAIAIAVGAVLAFTAPVVGVILPVLLFLVLSGSVYVIGRRGIIAAKRDGDWYRDVAVQQSAEVTAPVHRHVSIVWPIVAIAAIAVAAAIGAALYPRLPDPMPVHFDIAGVADRFEPKSFWSVFTTLPTAAGIALALTVLAIVVGRAPLRATPGDAPAGALERAAARRTVISAMLGQLAAGLAVSLSLINVLVWVAPAAGLIAGILTTVVLIVVVMAIASVRFARIALPAPASTRPASASASAPTAPRSAPDDDHRWKAGILYVNRDDPAVWVPRRFGIGWTPNLGNPVGIAVGVVLVAVIVATVAAVVLLPLLTR